MILSENRYPLFRIMPRRAKGVADRRHPCLPFVGSVFLSRKAPKLRLTLFLQPNHGFGQSFHGPGRRRPHHSLSDAFAEPARQFAKTLNQGIGAVEGVQPGADILQPCQIGLGGLLAQGQFGILLLPK